MGTPLYFLHAGTHLFRGPVFTFCERVSVDVENGYAVLVSVYLVVAAGASGR